MRLLIGLALFLLLLPVARADDPLAGVDLARLGRDDRRDVREAQAAPTATCEVREQVRCRAGVYRFLLGRLALAARAVDALGLEGTGRYLVEDAGAGRFTIDDRAGATADCSRAWDEEGLLVVVARGRLDVPVLPRILGTGVIVVRYAPTPDDPGLVAARAHVLFRLSNRLLRALSTPVREVLARVLRDKLALLVRTASALAEALERDPAGVLATLEAAGTVDQDDLRALRAAVLDH
ncbi:MAG: hypothetical protein M9894_35165 [Planctomycetes bacterium]|nr:hypothetical protein [Planctomycetota bacterium]